MRRFNVSVDGGQIFAQESGDAEGFPVFFIHPAPGSRVVFNPQREHAEKHGIRLLTYSRPGYGGSSRRSGRSVLDGASDIISIADHLGIDSFSVCGYAEGGPYALAAAASAPGRVRSSAVISSYAPPDADHFDFYSGMGELSVQDFKLLTSDEGKWDSNNLATIEMVRQSTKEHIASVMKSMYPEADADAISEDLIEYMTLSILDGCSGGIDGVRDDRRALLKSWGFDPRSIEVPVQMFHGTDDTVVPIGHGKWLSKEIPGAESHLLDNEGHLSVFVNNIEKVQKWLVSGS